MTNPGAVSVRTVIDGVNSSRDMRAVLVTPPNAPVAFGLPEFPDKFNESFSVKHVALEVQQIRVEKTKEGGEIEPFYGFGYGTDAGGTVVNLGRWDSNSTPVSVEDGKPVTLPINDARFAALPLETDFTIIFRIYDDNGEALRTETLRIYSELEKQVGLGLSVAADKERLASLQLSFIDWLPLVDWVFQFGQWTWSLFTETSSFTPRWRVPIDHRAFFRPKIGGRKNNVVSIEAFDGNDDEIPLATNLTLPQLLEKLRDQAVRVRVTRDSLHTYATVRWCLDIYFAKK